MNIEDLDAVDADVIRVFLSLYGADVLACPHCHAIVYDVRFIFQFLAFQGRVQNLVVPTSYYRCPVYNASVGGAKNSRHLEGRAMDFVIPGVAVDDVVRAARFSGMTTILYYPSDKHWHLDNVERQIYLNLNFHK
jgi:hypothetical protein